ncbi:uncharacterized protein LOC128741406 [Sabethes cyaneus]|uniref:uncharacterized protein LOC128741406 n=1 Tax=Sabethes cyaneus TaxID=53552 RepID=UPI00237D4115|nr:uncharacterized protein LOC128741406 [Sabethes cyaneus]
MITHSVAILLVSVSISVAFDWYSFTEQNYAAIQSGLAHLNEAARGMNTSMVENQQISQNAIRELVVHINQSLISLQRIYPEAANLSTDQLPTTTWYTGYVESVTDQFRQASTNNVMMPAQGVVRNILNAMDDLYHQDCGEKYAADLIQPRISVGRLRDCLTTNIPFFQGLTETTQLLMRYSMTAVDATIAQVQLCSPNSRSCFAKFFTDLPRMLSNIINNIINLNGVPNAFSQPANERNQECVSLITNDIDEAIQDIKANVSAAKRPFFTGFTCVRN